MAEIEIIINTRQLTYVPGGRISDSKSFFVGVLGYGTKPLTRCEDNGRILKKWAVGENG